MRLLPPRGRKGGPVAPTRAFCILLFFFIEGRQQGPVLSYLIQFSCYMVGTERSYYFMIIMLSNKL